MIMSYIKGEIPSEVAVQIIWKNVHLYTKE